MSAIDRHLRVAVIYHGNIRKDKTYSPDKITSITVGQDPTNNLLMAPVGVSEGFVLFKQSAEGLVLRLSDLLDGKLHLRNENFTISDFITNSPWAEEAGTLTTNDSATAKVYETVIKPGDWGAIRLGDVEVVFQFVIPPATIFTRAGVGGISGAIAALTTGLVSLLGVGLLVSILTQGGFVFYAYWSFDPEREELLALLAEDRFVEIQASDVEELEEEEEEELEEPDEEDAGKRAEAEEGKFGEEDPEDPETVLPDLDAKMVEELPDKVGLEEALGSDLLGPNGGAAALFGAGDMFGESMDQVAMSGEGDAYNAGFGFGGMGNMGRGKGGGGTGAGRIGGLADHDTGGGRGSGKGLGKKKRVKVKPQVKFEAPKQDGFCKADNIKKVVKKKAASLRNCYERQLLADPQLAGKIQLQWKIMVDGTVKDPFVKTTTMKNDKVETCMTRVVTRMRFDKPDGGICVIQYPFTFQPGG